MQFRAYFKEIVNDILKSVINPISFFFPFIDDHILCRQFSILQKNYEELRNVLKRFLDKSADESSVYKQLIKVHNVD